MDSNVKKFIEQNFNLIEQEDWKQFFKSLVRSSGNKSSNDFQDSVLNILEDVEIDPWVIFNSFKLSKNQIKQLLYALSEMDFFKVYDLKDFTLTLKGLGQYNFVNNSSQIQECLKVINMLNYLIYTFPPNSKSNIYDIKYLILDNKTLLQDFVDLYNQTYKTDYSVFDFININDTLN